MHIQKGKSVYELSMNRIVFGLKSFSNKWFNAQKFYFC